MERVARCCVCVCACSVERSANKVGGDDIKSNGGTIYSRMQIVSSQGRGGGGT